MSSMETRILMSLFGGTTPPLASAAPAAPYASRAGIVTSRTPPRRMEDTASSSPSHTGASRGFFWKINAMGFLFALVSRYTMPGLCCPFF